jgi:hypothetical protein
MRARTTKRATGEDRIGEMAHMRSPKKTLNGSSEPLTCGSTELLKRIAADCRDPARLVELYYWSAEPELAEVMRQYMALSEEVRAALHAFLMLANDPASVTHQITNEGDMILSSPATAEVARNLADIADIDARPPVVVH